MFEESPVGILLLDNEGNFIHGNKSILNIIGTESLDSFNEFNLFNIPSIDSKRELLEEKGLINFKTALNLENGTFVVSDSKKEGFIFTDWTISSATDGFLVQIQEITDLSDQKSLKESEEKYRSWFDDDLTGDFIALPDGQVMECNPAFIEIYGFNDRLKATKSNISQFNPSDWEDMINHLKAEHRIKDYQSWHRRPDGEQIHVVANVVGIFDEVGELVQVKGYVFDDTERKIAEESLKKSEEKYHRLFDEDLTGDFISTLDGKILECNPAFAEIYGFNNCEMALQWNISQSNPFDWPYMVTRLKKERKIQGFQSWQRRSDAQRIHVVANVVGIFDEVGELVQVKGYVFDDTERKQAEEELTRSKLQMSEILDSIKDCFIALNQNWNFIYVNQSAAEYFGVESDEIVGQNIWDIFPELENTDYEMAFRDAIKTHEIIHFKTAGIQKLDEFFEFTVYPSNEGISVYWRNINE